MTLPLRILHLEDDPFDAKLIKLALDEGGIDSDMCCVMTLNDFVISLESCGFDMVLSDYSLPGFDGLSALQIVKERFPHMPFVFVSGNMGEERAIESLKKGATDYVLKNNMARLAPSVLRALRETQERSEREQTEEALKKSADEINDLYNNAPCGYHSLEKDGVFVRINNTELSWLGYTRVEVIGKMRFPDILTPGSLDVHKVTFPVLKKRGWVRDLEFDMVRKDGSILPVFLSATAIKDAKGNFIMTRSTMFDISGRKEMEKQMASTNELLKLFSQKASAKEYFDEVVKKISK